MTRPLSPGRDPNIGQPKARPPVSETATQADAIPLAVPAAPDLLRLTGAAGPRPERVRDEVSQARMDRVIDGGGGFDWLTGPGSAGSKTSFKRGRKEKLAPIGALGKLLGSSLDAEAVKAEAAPLLRRIGEIYGEDSTVYRSARDRVEAYAPAADGETDRPGKGEKLPTSPKGQTLIVNANVAEKRFGEKQDADMKDASDLETFVDRTFDDVPYAPDALVLQEADPSAARKVAKLMSEKFGYAYEVKAAADGNAIIVNTDTMNVVGPAGEVTTHAKPEEMTKNPDGVSTQPDRTHIFLPIEEKGKGGKALTLASVHTHPTGYLKDDEEEALAKKWIKQITSAMGGADAGNLVLSGDYNHAQFQRESDELADFWKMMTGPKMGFHDALMEGAPEDVAADDKRIDFMMSHLGVLGAGSDTEYQALKDAWKKLGKPLEDLPEYYSDHAFQWTLLDTRS